ncbi:hypothetical protein shim_07340 [Shimia sp. SK013]|uniref:DUF4169 family protein n=1 Tax=Shimia sp. SK013 TaxID=1389006 RepID=UPI0006CC25B5|nr:DUF4169 family protein [Shimia sp. SK013]KPA22452.1 hypothetical protein shim_07340 [Shimia sp. SK013]
MSNVTNLNQFRKTKAKVARKSQADENAAKFGRSKAQKNSEQTRQEKLSRNLDGKEKE